MDPSIDLLWSALSLLALDLCSYSSHLTRDDTLPHTPLCLCESGSVLCVVYVVCVQCVVGVCVCCVWWVLYKSMKTRTDVVAMVRQSNEHLISLFLVSVQTPLVYTGFPAAFNTVAKKNGERKYIEIGREHSIHPVVTRYNRLASLALPPPSLITYTRHFPVAQAGHHIEEI